MNKTAHRIYNKYRLSTKNEFQISTLLGLTFISINLILYLHFEKDNGKFINLGIIPLTIKQVVLGKNPSTRKSTQKEVLLENIHRKKPHSNRTTQKKPPKNRTTRRKVT